MNTKRHYLPALRGRFGDWAYYSGLMTLKEVAARIGYAVDIHGKGDLSTLIQRELNEGRAKQIAAYLNANEDRFFNSLVVAIYGGKPQWHPFDVKPAVPGISVEDLDDTARYSVGYLSLTNDEKVFALDGQHRLAGIKKALTENPALADEELSVIFVAHHKTTEGLRRTRKLFTTLNKQAKPVKKSEIIALDESDVVAIVTRHLVENHKYFNNGQIDILRKQANLSHGDAEHFTTIINLYDTLDIILLRLNKQLTPAKAYEYKSFRPADEEIADFIKYAENFYVKLGTVFPPVRRYFATSSNKQKSILKKMRSPMTGHVLFRPIGMLMFCQILSVLSKKHSLNASMKLIAKLPTQLNKPPYAGTIWNPITKTVDNKKQALCRDLLLYMLGHTKGREGGLLKKYADSLGKPVDKVALPNKVH